MDPVAPISYKAPIQSKPISKLPDEILMKIFTLFSPKDVCTACLVCRKWSRLLKDNHLWRRLVSKKITYDCDHKTATHRWDKLFSMLTLKKPEDVFNLYIDSPDDPCIRKYLGLPDMAFRVIGALFNYQLTPPKMLRHPFLKIQDGKLITFPTLLNLDKNICYFIDELGRNFIILTIRDLYNRDVKRISLQQKDVSSGDWYVKCHTDQRIFRFVKEDNNHFNCGKLLINGKIVDENAFNNLKILIEKKELRLNFSDQNFSYQLEG